MAGQITAAPLREVQVQERNLVGGAGLWPARVAKMAAPPEWVLG